MSRAAVAVGLAACSLSATLCHCATATRTSAHQTTLHHQTTQHHNVPVHQCCGEETTGVLIGDVRAL